MIERVAEKLLVRTPTGQYPIVIGAGLLRQVGDPILNLPFLNRDEGLSTVCAIITNPTIRALYGHQVAEALRARNFQPHIVEIPEGEQYKTLETVRVVYDQLIDAGLDRRSVLYALGGGVVGDVAGFVAATLMRGVPFVNLPTTLLAMVDSSIGGKVGVDHPRGKNLIGAFYQPLAVVADTDTLSTLPEIEFRCGLAEVVKHGILADSGLIEQLKVGNSKLEAGAWLSRAMRVKIDLVELDPFELGERARLNLGHTFAHAIEHASSYRVRHGEAVAMGLVCAARLASRRGLCEPSLGSHVEKVLRAVNLPTKIPRELPTDSLVEAMQTDKKRVNAQLRFVLPRALGAVVVVNDVPRQDVVAVIEENKS